MGLFIAFVVWYNIWGKNNPKVYRKTQDILPKIFFGIFIISAITSMAPPLFIGSMILFGVLAGVFVVPYLIIKAILKAVGVGNKKARKDDFAYYQQHYQAPQRVGATITGLTKSVAKRRKIVEKFSKKNALNLTDEEIMRIVDASYMSNCWECEIYEMSLEYDSIYQWYRGDTGWLRAYLHVFPIQNVSSDFEMQHNICLDSFDEIFRSMRPEAYTTVDAYIKAINDKYLTAFDETTFMIAYRFLEANGRKYNLPRVGLANTNSELDELQKKYDSKYNSDLDDLSKQYDAETGNMLRRKV